MAEQLAGISSRLILPINASDGAREVFGRFAVEEVMTTYTIATTSGGSSTRAKELIVRDKSG